MNVSQLRLLLAGILEIKPAVKKAMHELVDRGRFLHLGVLSSTADIFTDINLDEVKKQIEFLDSLDAADRAVLDSVLRMDEPNPIAEKKDHNRGGRRRRSTNNRATVSTNSDKIRKAVHKLHRRNPGQSNREIQEKLVKQGITESLQRINGFRAHLNGVGFHAKGKKPGRKKRVGK